MKSPFPNCVSELKDYSKDDVTENLARNDIVTVNVNDVLAEDSKSLTSAVWKRFQRLLNVVTNILVLNFAFCTGCKNVIGFNGKSTTQLLKHLHSCAASKGEGNGRSNIIFNADDLLPLRDAAAKFVCLDFRPVFGTEGQGLRDYIYAGIQLAKHYPNMNKSDLLRAMPSRNTVSTHIQNMAGKANVLVAEMLQAAINECGGFGVTCDLWTDKMNSTPFITVTAHFFAFTTGGLVLKSLVVELCEMTCDSMTGANILAAIVKSFASFNITESILKTYACFVTDRGANMLNAVKDFESHACLAHLCNSVVGKMLDVPEAKTIIENASKLVQHVKKNHIASKLSGKLKSHVETRWNTAYDMIMSIIASHQELYELLQNKESTSSRLPNSLDKLTVLSMSDMKAMSELLVFFKNVTMAVEGDGVTLHNYWLTLREMKRILSPNRIDSALIKAMKNVGLRYIESAEVKGDFQANIRHKTAVFLHPQLKGLNFACSEERNEIHSHVKQLIENENHATESQANAENEPSNSFTGAGNMSLFQGYFDDETSESMDDQELERYIVSKITVVMKKFNLR